MGSMSNLRMGVSFPLWACDEGISKNLAEWKVVEKFRKPRLPGAYEIEVRVRSEYEKSREKQTDR